MKHKPRPARQKQPNRGQGGTNLTVNNLCTMTPGTRPDCNGPVPGVSGKCSSLNMVGGSRVLAILD